MPRPKPSDLLQIYLQLLDDGFDAKAWHGPTLRGSLRRVDAVTAVLRPGLGRHSIWEHAIHAAYWKYTVRRKLTGEARGSFPMKGSNWFVRPDPGIHADDYETAWKADLSLLDDVHATLRAAVENFNPDDLEKIPTGAKLTHSKSIYSIALHDVYHAGQIQLIKRLLVGSAAE